MQLKTLGFFFKTWYPSLIMMVIIFVFSSFQAVDSDKQSGLIVNVLNTLFPGTKDFSSLVTIIRKNAHFLEYTLLGFFTARALNLSHKNPLHSIWISALYATSDEVHQSFVPGRSCELRDILIDTTGAAFGSLIYILTHRKTNKK